MSAPALRSPSFKLRKSSLVSFSASGRLLAQITMRVVIWDTANRSLIAQYNVIKHASHLCFSPNEKVLAVKNTNGEIVFCDPISGKILSATGKFAYYREGRRPAFTSNGEHLIDGDWNGVLRLIAVAGAKEVEVHDFSSGYMFGPIEAHTASATFVAALNAKSSTRGGSKLLLYREGQPLDRPTRIHPSDSRLSLDGGWRRIKMMALHPSGKSVALGLDSRTPDEPDLIALVALDGSSTKCIELESRSHNAYGLAWSQPGIVCFTVHENAWRQGMSSLEYRALKDQNIYEHVHLYSDTSLLPLAEWPWKGARGVAFSPDGSALAIASSGKAGAYYANTTVWSTDSKYQHG
jgi:WD40 repeat protein